ncbi:MAG: hypothetical protein ACRELY_15850, partial [Polyangiaceae bacterium]
LKQTFTAAELGAEICRIHASNPVDDLKHMGKHGSSSAREFFTPAHLTDVQSLLDCGALLAQNMDGNFQTAIGFTDDSNTKQEVGIVPLKMTDIPTKFGFTKHAFSGVNGFCRTTDVSKANAPTVDCGPTTDAALAQGTTWFFGSRSALEAVGHAVSSPKADLTTQVGALNDAASAVEGLGSMRISADVKTAKTFLASPCGFGATQTAGSITDFMTACFPNTDEKTIDDIDAKIRAAAFEMDPAIATSGAIHGNIVLVARDDDSAKQVEKDANDLVTDWKSTLENNEAKLVKQAKDDPSTRGEKRWAIIVDDFLGALQKMKVARDGHTVKLSFNAPLPDADKKDLADVNAKSADRHQAVADILDAIQQKKPVPQAALTKIVGGPWATYLGQMATFDATKMPTDCPKKIAASKKKGAPPLDPACVVPVEPPESQFGPDAAKAALK